MPILITVPAGLAGSRLDAALHLLRPALSRALSRQLCGLGSIWVDGVRGDPGERLRAGSVVAFEPGTVDLSLQLRLPVVYADADALVLHKPAGLAVHRGPLVVDSVAARLEALPGAGLVHRLDRGTSGLLLVGRSPEALRLLAQAMEHGGIVREYLAIGAGVCGEDARSIDLPLRSTDEPRGNRPKVVVDAEHGQPALTHLRVLDRRSDCTLFAARLETGRTHQIRAHLAAIGHPLLGDPRYGDAEANARAHGTHGIDRPLLHSYKLQFAGPRSGALIALQAAHEPDFVRLFRSLRARPGPISGS